MNVSATDKSGGRISAKTSLFGYVNVDGGGSGAEAIANADKVAGPATATKTVTLTPRGGADANGMVLVTVRTQDGPDVKFNYRVVTTPTPTPTALPITPRSVLPRVGVITSYGAPRPGSRRHCCVWAARPRRERARSHGRHRAGTPERGERMVMRMPTGVVGKHVTARGERARLPHRAVTEHARHDAGAADEAPIGGVICHLRLRRNPPTGRAPKLIVGRSRLTAQPGDRLNVFWRTSPRR